MQKLRALLPQVTPKQVTETGLLAVLLCLGWGLYQGQWGWCRVALILGSLLLVAPRVYYPLAVGWFALGRALGWVTTTVLLTVLFGLLVIPVAFLRRRLGRDPMRLGSFGQGTDSVFVVRNHHYTTADLQHPF
jgi:hypothetical protein